MTLLKFTLTIIIACICRHVEAQPKHEILLSPVNATGNKAAYSDLLVLNDNWDTLRYRKFYDVFVSNFQQWETKDGTRYSYYLQDTNAYVPIGTSYTSGSICITDTNLNIINQLMMLPNGNITQVNHAADGHDFIYIDDAHYIILGYLEEARNNIPAFLKPMAGVRVLSSVIEEVQNGKVIWQWNSSDHPELYEASKLNNNFSDTAKTQDYLHINSLFIDPNDKNLVVSCKNSNQVLKLNRKTGNIIWRLGGKKSDFVMNTEQQFIHQHHATFTKEHSLLLFDNGDDSRPRSRVIEFTLDEANKKIKTFKSIMLPGIYTPAVGSVQKFDGTYFISTGTACKVLEVKQANDKIEIQYQLPYASYRVLKY
ncbi:MAG: hypothetical protein EOP51_16755 [Sphingobacteriales bacterium]|nr:MAG: hypothetical protein EOP51_16755 [Sphingobacteriales bacterium]